MGNTKYQQALQHANTQYVEFMAEARGLIELIGAKASEATEPQGEPTVKSLLNALDVIESRARGAREALATAAGAARDIDSLRNGALKVFA